MSKEELIELIKSTFVLKEDAKKKYLAIIDILDQDSMQKIYDLIVKSENELIEIYKRKKIDLQNKDFKSIREIIEKEQIDDANSAEQELENYLNNL